MTLTLLPVLVSKLATILSSGVRMGPGASRVISLCARALVQLTSRRATAETTDQKYFECFMVAPTDRPQPPFGFAYTSSEHGAATPFGAAKCVDWSDLA